jgi:hypothetical protein
MSNDVLGRAPPDHHPLRLGSPCHGHGRNRGQDGHRTGPLMGRHRIRRRLRKKRCLACPNRRNGRRRRPGSTSPPPLGRPQQHDGGTDPSISIHFMRNSARAGYCLIRMTKDALRYRTLCPTRSRGDHILCMSQRGNSYPLPGAGQALHLLSPSSRGIVSFGLPWPLPLPPVAYSSSP